MLSMVALGETPQAFVPFGGSSGRATWGVEADNAGSPPVGRAGPNNPRSQARGIAALRPNFIPGLERYATAGGGCACEEGDLISNLEFVKRSFGRWHFITTPQWNTDTQRIHEWLPVRQQLLRGFCALMSRRRAHHGTGVDVESLKITVP